MLTCSIIIHLSPMFSGVALHPGATRPGRRSAAASAGGASIAAQPLLRPAAARGAAATRRAGGTGGTRWSCWRWGLKLGNPWKPLETGKIYRKLWFLPSNIRRFVL